MAEQTADVGENLNQPSGEIATPANGETSGEDEGETNPPVDNNDDVVPPADNGSEGAENPGEGESGESENGNDDADSTGSPDAGVTDDVEKDESEVGEDVDADAVGTPEGTEVDGEDDAGSEADDAIEVNASISTSSMEIQEQAETSTVTIRLISAYPSQGIVLPEGATWTVSVDGQDPINGTFAPDQLILPVNILDAASLPFGTYTVTVDADPVFFALEATLVVDEASHEFEVAVVPDINLWPLQSTNEANVANGEPHVIQIESEACGTVTLQYVNPESPLAFFEARVDGEPATTTYGPHWVVPNDVMYGGENLYPGDTVTKVFEGEVVEIRFALGNPGPAFFDWTSFTSEPCPVAEGVVVNVTSADPQVANTLPADASWVVSLDGAVLDGDTFAADHLQLPAEIAVSNPVPVGTYDVTINAEPVFEVFTGQIEVTEESRVFNIELQPVVEDEEPTPTEPVDPDPTPTEPVDPDPTPTEPVTPGTQSLVIQVQLPGGEDIEGAPYSLYAPVAAQQFMAEPYAQGFVGPDNTIRIDGLIEGNYRLVIEPEGMEPIEVLLAVGNDPVTEAVIIVDENGEATVVYAGQEPPVTETPEAETDTPAPTSSVTGLPETGQGSTSPVGSMLVAAAFSVVLLGAGAFAVRRHHS